jgi:hypothetical protein
MSDLNYYKTVIMIKAKLFFIFPSIPTTQFPKELSEWSFEFGAIH